MPEHEFLCNDCRKAFPKFLIIHRYEKERMACPHCPSKSVAQRGFAFSTATSKKSA